MDVTDVIGRFGPWQRRILYVILYRSLPMAFFGINVQFYTPEMDYWCAREEVNASVEEWRSCCLPPNSKCQKYEMTSEGVNTNVTVKCDSWEFDSRKYGANFKEEWFLVCDRSWLIGMSYALMTLGSLLMYTPAGNFADRYGRKRVCLTGMVAIIFFGLMGSLSPSIEFFLVHRLLTGLSYGLFQTTSLCLFVEAVGPEYRNLMTLAFQGSWGVGIMLVAGVAYVIKDWRNFIVVSYIPLALVTPLLVWKFVPESPRWLLTAGRYDEAEKIILEASKMNGIEILDIRGIKEELKKKIEDGKQSESIMKKVNVFDLFRTKNLRRMTIMLWSTITLTVFVSNGFTLTVFQLGGNLHLNFFILGLTEACSSGILLLEAKYMNRRRALLMNYIVSGISFLAAIAIPNDMLWLQISVSMLGRTFISMDYALLWLLSAEIFPTSLRAVGVSGGMTSGRIGNLLASFMDPLARLTGRSTLNALFGSLTILASVLFLLLPETKDRHLPDTVKESERLPAPVEDNG